MNTYTEQRLEEIGHRGYELRFNEIFDQGFTIWKRVTLPIAGVVLLMALVFVPLYFFAVPVIFGKSFQEIGDMMQKNPEAFQELMQSWRVQLSFSTLALFITLLVTPISAGFIGMCRDAEYSGGARFGSAFRYYKSPYWGRIFLISLLSFLITALPGYLFGLLGTAGSYINILYSVCVHVFMIFAVPLVIFADASPIQAIGASFKLGAKGFLPLLGFSILAALLVVAGGFVCCVGLLFSLSYAYVINYLAYRQTIGFEEPSQGEEPAPVTEPM